MPAKHLIGITSPAGVQYVGIDTDSGVRWFQRSLFTATDKIVVATLSARGFHLIGKDSLDSFRAKLDRLTDFPVGPVAASPGWNQNDVFVLDADTIFAPGTSTDIPIALDPQPTMAAMSGTLAEWQDKVAKPVAKQPLAGFLMMAAFLPAILRFTPHVPNAVFEIVGRGGIGKSTLLQLAASVWGGPDAHGEGCFWHSFGVGADALPSLIEQHRDQLLILDELNALLASPDKKAVAKAYLRLGHGLGRAPSSHPRPGGAYRGLALIAGNYRVRVLAQKPPIEGDQTITLVPDGWLHGVFPKLPTGYNNGASYAEALAAAAARAHGTAIRAFLPKLIDDLANRARLERRLERWQDRFLTKTGVDRNNGQAVRTARVLAAVYAAGMLAKRYKVLPSSFACQAAAMACLKLHLVATAPPTPLRDRLEALIESGDIVAVSKGTEAHLRDSVETALGTLTVKPQYREVRVRTGRIGTVFPDWDQRRQEARSSGLLHGERGGSAQDKAKAKLAPWLEKERLYCFRLPLPKPSIFEGTEADDNRTVPVRDDDDEWTVADAAE